MRSRRATSSIPSRPTIIFSVREAKRDSERFLPRLACRARPGKTGRPDSVCWGILLLSGHDGCYALHFSADTAVWWQQGKGCHMRRTGKLGVGAFEMVACAVYEILLDPWAKLLTLSLNVQ